jgi:KAP family P-loop domain
VTRKQAILRRWIYIFIYSALGLWFGAFAALLCCRLWQLIFRLWPQSLINLEYGFLTGTSAIFLVAFLIVTRMRPRQSRYFWSYPPLLSCVLIIGTGIVIALFIFPRALAISDTVRWASYLSIFSGWLVVGLLLPFLYRRRRHATGHQSNEDPRSQKLQDLTAEELLAWLADERAIESSAQDFFGAQDRAHRIWNALNKRRSAAKPHLMQTVVVEGPFGSGKTSVVSLLRNIVKHEGGGKYLLIQVSAWGFSSIAARQHILNQVIEVLSKDVDCLAVRDLPRDYVEALTESNKWFALLKPSLSEIAPVERLRRLLPILAAIDIHLVVVIEDSDRNDIDFNPQHLQSMLNDFREVERLSFVLTVGSTSRVDFPKIAEQIESIPRLSRGEVLSIVDRVRDYCRERWPAIDPLANEPE